MSENSGTDRNWRKIIAPGIGLAVSDDVLAQRVADRIVELENEVQRLSIKCGESAPPIARTHHFRG